MYTSFHIKNFRGFEDFELNDLARINLIAGRNNVGKTALLEALFIFSNPINPELTLAVNALRGMKQFRVEFGKWQTRTPWDTLFPNFNTSHQIELDGTHGKLGHWQLYISIVEDIDELATIGTISTQSDVDQEDNGSYRTDIFASDVVRVIKMEVVRKDNAVSKHYMAIDNQGTRHSIPTPILPEYQTVFVPSRERLDREDANRFSDLKRQRNTDLLLKALQIIESRIEDLDFLSDGIYGEVKGLEQLVPLSTMGDGVTRLMSLILAISHAPGGVVLIDEIENGLHHTVQIDVWKAIAKAAREFDVQIFATTHSLEMIRAAHEAFRDQEPYDFRLHRLDRSTKTGEIYATTYDKESMEAAVELSAEVR